MSTPTPEPNPPNVMRWKTGTPDVPNGKMENFWCCINTRDGKNFHRFLCYGNAYEMPLGDDCYDPPENAVPVGDDGDYAWTGWFSESCEQCDTQWLFDGEVIAWARLPKFEPSALTPPAVEKAATDDDGIEHQMRVHFEAALLCGEITADHDIDYIVDLATDVAHTELKRLLLIDAARSAKGDAKTAETEA